MTNTKVNRESILSLLSEAVALIVALGLMTWPSAATAQNADAGVSVQPSARVRLMGFLTSGPAHVVEFPQLRVWIEGTPWLFHVCQIEPLMPTYPAEQELRKVSNFGLRFLADKEDLASLQRAEALGHPIVVDGQLRVRARVFRVDATHPAEGAPGGVDLPAARTNGCNRIFPRSGER